MAAAEAAVGSNSKKKKFSLKSSEGDTFEVDEAVALQLIIIKNMLSNEEEEETNHTVFPLSNVKSRTLSKVIEYCKQRVVHDETSKKKSENELKEDWESKFIGAFNQAMLYDLMMAANFLGIKSLLDLVTKEVAGMIQRKTPEQIRKTFHIENDFTPEEEAKHRKEHAWAFDENNPH